MSRATIAFAVAPLVVPIAVLIFLSVMPSALTGLTIGAVTFAAIVSYVGTLGLGAPAYVILSARGFTSILAAAVTGAMVGVATLALIPIVWSGTLLLPVTSDWLIIYGVTGTLGSVVGTVFWCIARPDRIRQRLSEAE